MLYLLLQFIILPTNGSLLFALSFPISDGRIWLSCLQIKALVGLPSSPSDPTSSLIDSIFSLGFLNYATLARDRTSFSCLPSELFITSTLSLLVKCFLTLLLTAISIPLILVHHAHPSARSQPLLRVQSSQISAYTLTNLILSTTLYGKLSYCHSILYT